MHTSSKGGVQPFKQKQQISFLKAFSLSFLPLLFKFLRIILYILIVRDIYCEVRS